METIGIFEAKTKLPSVCDQVAASGQPVTISRRGKPLVVVSPATPPKTEREGILTALQNLQKQKDHHLEDEIPNVWEERTTPASTSPLED